MPQRYTHAPWDPPSPRPVVARRPSDIWALAKQIDELGGEWTFSDFVERAANFHHQGRRINFYEHTGGWDEVTRETYLVQRAWKFGLNLRETGTVGLTFQAFPSLFNPVDGEIPMPDPSEACIGQHTARLVGASATQLLIQHGWSGWTPTKTAVLSRDYFDLYVVGGIVSRPWNRGPGEDTLDGLWNTSNADEFRRLWLTHEQASHTRISHDGSRLRFDVHPTWSLQAFSRAAVLSLTLPPDTRVAVAVVVYGDAVVQIGDLFVWPPYRRRGFGSLLESLIEEHGRSAGCSEAQIYLWAGDSVRGADRARAFMTRAGFAIEDYEAVDSAAIGRKLLP